MTTSLIDWSDPEAMLGLLAEYVADATVEETSDRERARFLRELSSPLSKLAAHAGELSIGDVLHELREILSAQPAEFEGDPALQHVADCIDELERIARH